MDIRKIAVFALSLSLASAWSCSEKSDKENGEISTTAAVAADNTDAAPAETVPAEEETTEELIPPTPVEASDPNTVTFDDGEYSFVTVISDDDEAAVGTLSVEDVMGNKMLKFTDDGSVPLDTRVQKLSINAAQLIGTENLAKVHRIEFDVYADALSDKYVNEDGENVKAPGWIGGGGGTVTAKDEKWYDFQEFSGSEYNFEMSGAVHGVFKFLVYDGGMCWSEDMADANFLIMRWGLGNDSNLYLDNIVFYDGDGNSIPIQSTAAAAPAIEEETAPEGEVDDAPVTEAAE